MAKYYTMLSSQVNINVDFVEHKRQGYSETHTPKYMRGHHLNSISLKVPRTPWIEIAYTKQF